MITNVFSRIGMVVVSLLVVLGITGGVVQAAAPDSSLLEKINIIQTKVTNIWDYLTNTTDGLPGIKTDIATVDAKVDTLIEFADVIDVTTDGLTDLFDPIDEIKTDTSTIKNYTDTLETTLTAIQNNMVKIESGSEAVPFFEYTEAVWEATKEFNFDTTTHVTLTAHTYYGNLNLDVGFPTDAEGEVHEIEPVSFYDVGEDTVKIYEFDARYFKVWAFTTHHSTATMYIHYTFTYPNE